MQILYSHITALEYWDWHARRYGSPDSLRFAKLKTPPARFASEEVEMSCADFHNPQNPIHIMVASMAGVHKHEGIEAHVFTQEIPAKSIHKAWRGVYVTSPELAFIQVASTSTDFEALLLGMEAAGKYSMKGDNGFCKRDPIINAKKLDGFIQRASNIHGVKRSKRVLRRICPNSASPLETEAALTISLPRKLGGFGLPKPLLNFSLPLSGADRLATKKESITVDMFWPDHSFALEYESDEWHCGDRKFVADSHRRNIIRYLGYDVTTITYPELCDDLAMERIAQTIAKRTGTRIRREPIDYWSRRQKLRAELKRWRSGQRSMGYLS